MGIEARLEAKVAKYALEKLGIQSVKWGVDGWPDRIFLRPHGSPVFIEFKAPGAKAMPRQVFRVACLKTWGYDCHICDNFDDAVGKLK